MESRRNVVYILGILIVIVATIVGISFAYIVGTQNVQNTLDVNVSIEDGVLANFVVTGNNNITLNVSGEKMLQGTANNIAESNNVSLAISMQSDIATVCSYDVVWSWNNTSDNYTLTSTTNDDNEFTISGSTNTGLSLEETQVSNYSSSKTLGTFTISANNSTSTQNWTFTANFYNLNANQDAHENKIYKGSISIANAVCRKQISQFATGLEMNIKMKMMANSSVTNSDFANSHKITDSIIKGVYRTDTFNTSANYSIVSTNDSDTPIYMWFDSATNNIYWYSNTRDVYLNENSTHLFNNLRAVTDIDTQNLHTNYTKLFTSMFAQDFLLVNADVSHFDTSNATSLASMFYQNYSRTVLDVSNFNTNKVTSMASMFLNVRNVQNIDVSNFNTSLVTSMASMFFNDRNLTSINVSGFNTQRVKNFSSMFAYLSLIHDADFDVSGFNTAAANNMSYMFRSMSNITTLNLSNFNTKAVINMQGLFTGMTLLSSLDISSFNTYKVTDMAAMFSNDKALASLNLRGFNTYKVQRMDTMFSNTRKLTTLDLTSFKTANVKNMTNMFNNATILKNIYVSSNFVTSAVVPFTNATTGEVISNEANMFYNCKKLVGGNGTTYNASFIDKTYARIDADGTPGYFSAANLLPS